MTARKDWFSRYREIIILVFIVIIGAILRFQTVDTPLADFHSERQVSSLRLAEQISDGIFLPEGYQELNTYYVEFPIMNAVIALSSFLFSDLSIIVIGRTVAVLFSLATIVGIYYLVRREAPFLAAIGAAGLFAILPFSVFFSRTVLPEIPALTAVVWSIVLLQIHLSTKGWPSLLLYTSSAILIGMAIATKPTVVVFLLPLLGLFARKDHIETFGTRWPYLYLVIAAVPFLLWYAYLDLPVIVPEETTLFSSITDGSTTTDRTFFSSLYVTTVWYERIALAILGAYLLGPVLYGIISKHKTALFHMIGSASLIFVFLFQGGNQQFAYYQYIILLAIVIYAGVGIASIWQLRSNLAAPFILIIMFVLVSGLGVTFSNRIIQNYYTYSADLVQIARIVSTITPADAQIVTDQAGDETLLFLSDRSGLAVLDQPLEYYREQGFDYIVSSQLDRDDTLLINSSATIIFENDQFLLLQL